MNARLKLSPVSPPLPAAPPGIAQYASGDTSTSESGCIRIYLLGRFLIVRNGEPLPFGRKQPKKPLSMLQMLIASGGLRADALILSGRLWPEVDGDVARQSFDINLHRLRKILGIPDVLLLSDGKLSFNARKCWIDVWAFDRVVAGIESATGSCPKSSDTDYLALARALMANYSGHFLEYETEEPWAVAFRDRLKAKFGRAVLSLAAGLEQQHKWDAAAALYSRALELDNLAEPLYRRLMICYRELDETAQALQVYRRCRHLLSVVFSIKPSAETEAVRATFG